jgi:hypothetical protein
VSTTVTTWDGPALLVPISLDAVLLTALSYNEGWSWIAPEYATLTLFLPPVQPLFSDAKPTPMDPAGDRRTFSTGAVLYWALPDALTAAGSVDPQTGQLGFGPTPNRWLVVRRVAGAPALTQEWILASDYLGGNGSAFYTAERRTTLGMCWTLAQWPGEAKLPAGISPSLTAIGTGEQTFAAYVPNIEHVFSFHDPLDGVSSGTVSYTVCGWHAGTASDPLQGAAAGSDDSGWLATLQARGWSTGDDLSVPIAAGEAWANDHGFSTDPDEPHTYLPSRTVYHAMVCGVPWQGAGDATVHSGVPTVTSDPNTAPSVTLAHAGDDALATLVSARAGDAQLAEVLTALHAEKLPLLDEADGADQIAVLVQQGWFDRAPGGTRWELVDRQAGGAPSAPPTAAQGQLLTVLNDAQQTLDAAGRVLTAHQREIYFLWFKQQYVSRNGLNPIPDAANVLADALSARQTLAETAIADWQTANQQCDTAQQALVAEATPLTLEPVPEAPFLQPCDPVLLIGGAGRSYAHGEDGRFTADGSVFCRFTGQTLSALQVAGTSTPVNAADVALPAFTLSDAPSEVDELLVESFFLDPFNAASIAAAANPSSPTPAATVAAQQTLMWNALATAPLDQQTVAESAGLISEYGPVSVPSKVAVQYWSDFGSSDQTHPPWTPLHLDWSIRYAPQPDGWAFPSPSPQTALDTQTAAWTGTLPTTSFPFQGRTLLTPGAVTTFAERLDALTAQFAAAPELQAYLTELNDAATEVDNAAVLSQRLSGLCDQLLQRDVRRFVPPDHALDPWLVPANAPAYAPTAAPAPDSSLPFSPLRQGFLQLEALWVVDDFTQRYDVIGNLSAHPELGGVNFAPDFGPPAEQGMALLKPRLLQPSRLRVRFLDADDDGKVAELVADAAPICGWLLPNRLDDGVLVYDAPGVLQGELLLAAGTAVWVPSPDTAPPGAGAGPPPLANPHLAAVLDGVLGSANSADALSDLIATLQKSSWASAAADPGPSSLSALIGSPVAVARLQLLLELDGPPVVSQAWAATGQDDDGGILGRSFTVCLGASDLYDDGLVGCLADADPAHLLSPYGPSPNGYATAATITVEIGQPVALTALLYPTGRIHAFTGVLPPSTATLPADAQAAPLAAMEITTRSGPVLTPSTELAAPVPSARGDWSWLEYTDTVSVAVPRPIAPVDTIARLPDALPVLRDGWLRLELAGQPTSLRYAVTPTAIETVDAAARSSGSLTLSAYNASQDTVVCSAISFAIVVGPGTEALTNSPDVIQPASQQADTWSLTSSAAGVFTAAPIDPTTSIAAGDTLTFTLANVIIDTPPGVTTVRVSETANQTQTEVNLVLEKIGPEG